MAVESHIVVFKPNSQSTKEYMVVVDAGEYKKWKDGDKTIPLVQVVDGFLIFASETGSQGKWLKPSAIELTSDFSNFNADGSVKPGTYDATEAPEEDEVVEEEEKKGGRKQKKISDEDAITIVLQRGKLQTSKHLGTGGAEMNPSKGSGMHSGAAGQPGR